MGSQHEVKKQNHSVHAGATTPPQSPTADACPARPDPGSPEPSWPAQRAGGRGQHASRGVL